MSDPIVPLGEARPSAPRSAPTGPDARAFNWFALTVASWFGAWGIQSVLFSWLVVGVLKTSAEWVGAARTATMLPSLLLLLVGGAWADRSDPRRLLMRLHVLAALPTVLLAGAVVTGRLSFAGLLLYGACLGTISALAMPARDTLLSRVAGGDMLRAVTGLTAAQFGSLALGTLAAAGARFIGTAPMLVGQALLLLLGALAAARLRPAPATPQQRAHPSALRGIAGGVATVARTPRLRAPLVLVMAVGFLFVGPFLVVFPLLVRDFYRGGVDELSIVLMAFPLGTIAGSLVLRARGLRRKGRAALIALVCGAAALAAVGTGLPFPAMLAATLAWGLVGAVFINCSRALYQEAAPALQRAQVLSIYQLGFMGAAPLGALASGFSSARFGPLDTLLAFAAGMLAVVCVSWLFTDVSRMD